jgi:hypothetical protein
VRSGSAFERTLSLEDTGEAEVCVLSEISILIYKGISYLYILSEAVSCYHAAGLTAEPNPPEYENK